MSTDLFETVKRFLILVVLVFCSFIIATYLFSMGLGVLVLFSTSEGLVFSRELIPLNPLLISDVEVNVNAGLYFLFLWWIFALCFVAAWKNRDGLLGRVQGFFSDSSRINPFTNNLLAMPAIASVLFVITLVLHALQSQAGFPTGEPNVGDPFLDFLLVSRAPIIEEIIFRVIPIGTLLVTYISVVGGSKRYVLTTGARLKTAILAVVQPDKAKEMMGLKTIGRNGFFGGGVSWGEWIMVLFTSSIFGVAHFLSGWGPGKISQASINGAVFALAYLYYGIQAPLLLHWYFNYYFTVFDLSTAFYSMEIDFAYSLFILANFFFGVLLLIALIFLCILIVLRKLRQVPKPPNPG
jgi:hypothetical protein